MSFGFPFGFDMGGFRGGGGGFDTDYQAVLDFATSEGITLPSANQQILQNNVVLSLKDKGLWNKKDAFGLFATDGNVDFALICWKRLIKMTAFNSPAFAENAGFTGNGTSSYIDTKFKSATDGVNFLLDDAGYSVNVGTTTPSSDIILGNSDVNQGGVRIKQKSDADFELNSSSFPTSANYQNGGNLHIDRINSTQVVLKDEFIITETSNSTTLTSNPALIFRIKGNYGNGNIKAFSARSSFTDQEKNDYNTIIDTYLNAI